MAVDLTIPFILIAAGVLIEAGQLIWWSFEDRNKW